MIQCRQYIKYSKWNNEMKSISISFPFSSFNYVRENLQSTNSMIDKCKVILCVALVKHSIIKYFTLCLKFEALYMQQWKVK